MDKVTTSSKNITPFDGLNLIYNTIIKAGIPDFLNNKIGYRSDFTEYSYSEIVLLLFENALCNGSYLSDLKKFKSKFSNQYFKNIPSHDTVGYACEELKLPNGIVRIFGEAKIFKNSTMKSKLIVYLLFVTSFLSAQSVDDYAAVIVPLKFDFQNSENEYRLSTFTKFNLEKAGFKAVYSNTDYAAQYPNRCSLLSLDLVRVSGFLNTKLYVSIKDCYGKEVYRSETGKSLEKEFDVAYKEALNLAFESIYRLEYKFNGKNSPQLQATIKEVEIKESTKPVVEEVEKAIVTPPTKNANVNLLYAQPTANGYQLIDKTPKVIMKLITTDDPTVFKAFKGDEEGVLSQRDNKWIFDSFKKDRFSEVLYIKF